MAFAKKSVPYVFAALAVALVLHKIDLQAFKAAVKDAPLGAFVAVSALMLVVNCAADTFAMTAVFSRFGCRVRYADLYLVRASTYILAIINYHVGQAAIVGYLVRVKRVPLLTASGWILFIIGINVGTLLLLASAGAAKTGGPSELVFIHWIPLFCGIGIVAYALLLTIKPRFLAERQVLKPLFDMGIPGHLFGLLVRLPHIGVLIAWHFISLRMFNVQIPFSAALLYLPLYFAVQNLPINVNGIGFAQLAAIYFFSPYTGVPRNPAAVTAYSLATATISLVLQIVMGLVCLRLASSRGLKPEPIEPVIEPAAPVEAEAG